MIAFYKMLGAEKVELEFKDEGFCIVLMLEAVYLDNLSRQVRRRFHVSYFSALICLYTSHTVISQCSTSGVSLKMHPYEEEITSLLDDPPLISNFCSNNKYSDMSTSYSWIDTEAQLESLAKLLSGEQVFAVDTEQHSLRSFLGYTALMQVNPTFSVYVSNLYFSYVKI